MVGGLRTCAAWTFIGMGNLQSVEVGEELTVSTFSVCGGGRGVDSVHVLSVWRWERS